MARETNDSTVGGELPYDGIRQYGITALRCYDVAGRTLYAHAPQDSGMIHPNAALFLESWKNEPRKQASVANALGVLSRLIPVAFLASRCLASQ